MNSKHFHVLLESTDNMFYFFKEIIWEYKDKKKYFTTLNEM